MIARIVIGLLAITAALFVWAWCKVAGDADDQAERHAIEANRSRLRTPKVRAGTRP